ncbi:MAG: sigma-70 family RNA polymerase sigma factor [Planctomycetales bacterium]|nr:sigma-70 family RNA polymerase sigma factor [Planctomycetales bacterium]
MSTENTNAQASDKSLLRRLREGQNDAATELYMRYASRLLTLARSQTSPQLATRFDPEDVVQSVFRTFFRRATAGLYDVPAGEQLWQLLLVLALNKVRGLALYHRAQKRDAAKTVQMEDLGRPSQVDDGTPMKILTMVVDELLTEHSETQQQIVKLRIDGHTIEQIAERTGRSRRTVERVMQEFRQRLSHLIDSNEVANGESIDDQHQSHTE